MTPQKLGKYKLIRKIASGGMAEIYLAKVSGLSGFEKLVVVKRILPQLAGDKQFIQMFLDEARIAATLQHPNIVQMYDIGAADGEYFISMEYIHGEDVRSVMRRLKQKKQWLPIDHSINIVIGVASGLHYAHEKRSFDGQSLNIVHRDVNPQNILISYDGAIKLLDFGIAKASNRLNEETRHGTLKGKIPYMSPEQCRGYDFDRRSDIYALGIMLYELTTATRLYRGASDFDIMKQIIEEPVIPPSVKRPGYPPELERIVMKALCKNYEPGDPGSECRYQTARELQADLESFVRRERLMVSDIALSSFMQELFEDHIEAWQAAGDEARAEQVARKAAGSRRMTDETIEIPGEELIADSSPEVKSYTPSANGEVAGGPKRRGRIGLFAAVGVVALGIAAGGYWLATRGAAGSSAASVPSPRTEAAAPTQGSARFESSPTGAAVFVDGAEWHEKTPTTVRGLAVGSHRLTLKLEGHDERSVSFHVTAGETAKVSLGLRPAAVASNGTAEQGTSAAHADDATDDEARPERGKRHEARKHRRKRKRARDKAKAKAKATRQAQSGTLRIASTPSCTVIVNGRSHGSTPIARIELPAGRHQVHLVNARFKIDRRYTVVIKPGEMTKRRYTFPIDR